MTTTDDKIDFLVILEGSIKWHQDGILQWRIAVRRARWATRILLPLLVLALIVQFTPYKISWGWTLSSFLLLILSEAWGCYADLKVDWHHRVLARQRGFEQTLKMTP